MGRDVARRVVAEPPMTISFQGWSLQRFGIILDDGCQATEKDLWTGCKEDGWKQTRPSSVYLSAPQ